jgi:hypothetical protein
MLLWEERRWRTVSIISLTGSPYLNGYMFTRYFILLALFIGIYTTYDMLNTVLNSNILQMITWLAYAVCTIWAILLSSEEIQSRRVPHSCSGCCSGTGRTEEQVAGSGPAMFRNPS